MTTYQTDGTITRTELSLATLAFTPANGYYIQRNGFGPGEVSHRKTYVESPYVIGQTMVHSVKDLATSSLTVRVQGTSHSDMIDKLETLCEAFEQFNYTLTIIIDGISYVYDCDTADYSIGDGGNVDDLWLRSSTQLVSFDIPHKPKQSGFR